MRWHVHGTDAHTGEDVELRVNDPEAAHAVRAAMDRQIVVSHMKAGAGLVRWGTVLAAALVLALLALGAGLCLQNQTLRGNLDQALKEQAPMAASVAQAQRTAASIRDSGNLAQVAATQVAQLADELAAAHSRMSLTEQQLSAAHNQLTELEKSAAQVPGLEAQLADARRQLADARRQLDDAQIQLVESSKAAAQGRAELALQSRRLEDLQNAAPAELGAALARADQLQKANGALAAEIDKLKAELLVLAARPDPSPPAAAPPGPAAPPPASRWAMRVAYETARDFLVLRVDGHALNALPAGGGTDSLIASGGVVAANAVQMRFVHDRAKERVYSAALSVSLAADAPPDKLTENKALITEFLHTFAPALKNADAVLAATAQLAGADASHRMVFLAEDEQITLWNDKTGVYTVRVESAHAEGE